MIRGKNNLLNSIVYLCSVGIGRIKVNDVYAILSKCMLFLSMNPVNLTFFYDG